MQLHNTETPYEFYTVLQPTYSDSTILIRF